MIKEEILVDYDSFRPVLLKEAEKLESLFKDILSNNRFKIHSIATRVKSRESFRHKISRPDKIYNSLWDVTDVLGLRVTTYVEDAVEPVAKLIEKNFPIDYVNSIDKRSYQDQTKFGYRSLHYVCGFGSAHSGILPTQAKFEIQIRTVLQHAWAEIEHDIGFKASDSIPGEIRRRFSRVASLLEIADQEFVSICSELKRYETMITGNLAGVPESSLTIDRISLNSFIHSPDVIAVDQAIAKILGKELHDEPFFPEYLLKMLRLSGLTTIADLQSELAKNKERVLAMVIPYFEFARMTWTLSASQLEHVQRGYGLFFLSHIIVYQSPILGISKVDRVARFYRELDYPNDQSAAHKVAIGLIEVLSQGDPELEKS
jgi:ppGpp synthetase/RelA/SpoT-type nucleotidyltranferase